MMICWKPAVPSKNEPVAVAADPIRPVVDTSMGKTLTWKSLMIFDLMLLMIGQVNHRLLHIYVCICRSLWVNIKNTHFWAFYYWRSK